MELYILLKTHRIKRRKQDRYPPENRREALNRKQQFPLHKNSLIVHQKCTK